MNRFTKTTTLTSVFLFISFLVSCSVQQPENGLNENMFKKPLHEHYPETWFHFIGGNVSKEGITADLEAIYEAGLSGIQLFHGSSRGKWPAVSSQIETLSEEWDDLIMWTAEECKRLGLNFTMQNCPGWSYAGGPWIESENSMRHLAYSRTDVKGGKDVSIQLEIPQPSEEDWRNYKDLFVIAFPTPEGDIGHRLIPSKVKSNRTDLEWNECLKEHKKINLKPSVTEPTIIDVEFENATTIRTIEFPPVASYTRIWCYSPGITVNLFADKGGRFEKIAHLDMPAGNWQDVDKPISIACKETTSQSYRIEISNSYNMDLSYINFYSAARQQNWESEAAWTLRQIVREEYPEQSKSAWIEPSTIVNITPQMDSLGKLTWNAPEGNWTVLRIGHINTGMKNAPAPPEATGWECNKLDVLGARANFNGYIGRLINDNEKLKNGLLEGILIDSWECKTQTWTTGLDHIFQEKWDYTLLSMFPAIFGYVVDNPETTSRFLRDWRVTLNDLLVENFFGEMKNIAQDNGLKIWFETASGDVFPGDILEYYKYADIPMCEFWAIKEGITTGNLNTGNIDFKPIRPTVSASRIYGKKRIAAEAFTSFPLSWNEHPGYLKDFADIHFSRGVTHLVFHTYTHNPKTDFLPPSSSFGSGIGTPFLRLQTWWQHMPHFTDYLARCTYMLESGKPVSDVLMYIGDEQNHKPSQLLEFPEGYAYDYCNPDVLLNRLSVKNGHLVTPEDISYRVLWLHNCKRMIPETLEKILSFAKQGIIVVGESPTGIASLGGGNQAEERFRKAVESLWGDGKQTVRNIGKGKVYNCSIDEALSTEKISKDINVNFSDVRWLHRKTEASDFYFLSTPEDKGYTGKISFRAKGNARIWDPLIGETKGIPSQSENEFTTISIKIPAGTSYFIVFDQSSSKEEKSYIISEEKEIESPWQLTFPNDWGIENPTLAIDVLVPWKDLPLNNEGKTFSGTVNYKTNLQINNICKDEKYMLDLGKVEMIAKIKLNGFEIATKWTYPYSVDITDYIKEGTNDLEIDITSTWFNRLVFDASLPEDERKTWTISGPKANSELKDYGLLGPIKVQRMSGKL